MVAGLVLFLDGIGLAAFCLTADRLGIGQGYGLGLKQMLGAAVGALLTVAGLSILLIVARLRPGTGRAKAASKEVERLEGGPASEKG